MEEEKNNAKRDSPAPKIDVWERLIKLDKKNSQLTMFNDLNTQPNDDDQKRQDYFWWPNGQIDQNIRSFWNHVNESYFSLVNKSDINRIDHIIKALKSPEKDATVKYADPIAYETFKSVVATNYKHDCSDSALSHINLHNLQKHYYISLLKSGPSDNSSGSDNEIIQNMRDFIPKQNLSKEDKSNLFIRTFLEEEAKYLDDKIYQYELDPEKQLDPINIELKQLYEEKENVNKENIKLLSDLKEVVAFDKAPILDPIQNACIHLNKSGKSVDSFHQGKSSISECTDINQIQLNYLENLIIKLEDQQAAETLKCVIDCRKLSDAKSIHKGYQFCVVFDEAICNKRVWIDESILQRIDRLREHSLFKIYDIPQKTRRSIYSPNIVGFQYCNKKIESNKDLGPRERKWKDLMKQMGEKVSGVPKEQVIEKFLQLGLCHQCRHLFSDEVLIHCNYRTSISSLSAYSSTLKGSKSLKNKLSKTSQNSLSYKRHPYLFYQRHNGELFCHRRYCRLCLKQNYDFNLADGVGISNFICPFCKENCSCSRCVRNDHINKLRTLYGSLGGDLENIKRESYYERFVCQYDPQIEELIKKKATPSVSIYALKPTRGRKPKKLTENIKKKIERYKKNLKRFKLMKTLRVEMEKARMLCSQVSKREKLKTKYVMLQKDIFNSRLSAINDITGQKRKDLVLDQSFEPPVSKKVKMLAEEFIKKVDMEDDTVVKVEEDEEEVQEILEETTVSNNPVVKRRGRPRKNPPTTRENPIIIEDDEPSSDTERPRSIKKKALKEIQFKTKKNEAKAYLRKTFHLLEDKRRPEQRSVTPDKKRGRPKKVAIEETIEGKKNKMTKLRDHYLQKDQRSVTPPKKNLSIDEDKDHTKRNKKSLERSEEKAKDIKKSRDRTLEKCRESPQPKNSLIKSAASKSSKIIQDNNQKRSKANNYKNLEKQSILKKELQSILDHQHEEQFEILKSTKRAGRITRNSQSKNKLKKSKKSHSSRSLQN